MPTCALAKPQLARGCLQGFCSWAGGFVEVGVCVCVCVFYFITTRTVVLLFNDDVYFFFGGGGGRCE